MSTAPTRDAILAARRAAAELLAADDKCPVLGPSLRALLQQAINEMNDKLYLSRQQRNTARRPRVAERPIAQRYCFCPGTPLWADRCPTCGRPPYTD